MSDKQYNVQSLKGTITIPTSDTVTTGTTTLDNINGVTDSVVFTTANMEGSDSTNFEVVNSDDKALITSGTKAESTSFVLGTAVGLVSGDKIVVTAEGTQSAARDIVYDIRYLR